MNGKRVICVWWDMMWILPSPQHWLWSHSKMTTDVQRLEGTLRVCLWWHFQRGLTKEEDVPWVWMAPSQGLGSWTELRGEMKKTCQVFPPHQFLVSYEGYSLLWYRTWIHGCSGQVHGAKWLQIDFSETWVKVNSSPLTHFCQVMVTVTRRWQSVKPSSQTSLPLWPHLGPFTSNPEYHWQGVKELIFMLHVSGTWDSKIHRRERMKLFPSQSTQHP